MKYLKSYNTFILENLTFSKQDLKTLIGLNIPEYTKGFFDCSKNPLLNSLEGAPKEVDSWFDCSFDKLDSLEGAPIKIGSSFSCYSCDLISLEGGPEYIGGNFNCYGNELISLEGGPEYVGMNYYCSKNNLTSLKGSPKHIFCNFDCSHNMLKNLDYLPEIGGYLYCHGNDWEKPLPYKIMTKYKLHCLFNKTDEYNMIYNWVYTQEQFDKFSSFEYQKEFLEKYPQNFMDLKPIGYADGIENIFPHLFDMDELGLID